MSPATFEYVYYSEKKINDLAQQVRRHRLKRALDRLSEVGVPTPAGPAVVGIREPSPEPILVAMRRVIEHLDAEEMVGSFDEPKKYFRGRLEFGYTFFDKLKRPVIFLVGATDRTIVALGGSKEHTNAYRGQEIQSAEDAVGVWLEPELANAIYEAEYELEELATEGVPSGDLWAVRVARMYTDDRLWRERNEFEVLASRHKTARVNPPFVEAPVDVLIGSPVYIALM